MPKNEKIIVLNMEVVVISRNEDGDYISMTDVDSYKKRRLSKRSNSKLDAKSKYRRVYGILGTNS